jgi:glyoxylase-like metal-dependent hydrolase (beta-lactamase superfamily II)
MNALESQLRYPFGDALPGPGETLEVAPGVLWLRMRLPFELDHINLWLMRDALPDDAGDVQEGWTIVDCGIADTATRAAWEQVFATRLEGLPVLRVVVTHMHPDHVGNAEWLCARWGVRLWMSATDYNAARLASAGLAPFGGPRSAAFFARHGLVESGTRAGIAGRTNYYASLVPAVPPDYRRLRDADRLEVGTGAARSAWTCHAGYGHAPEHVSLHGAAAGVLISGDMVLPRISTNVSVTDLEPEGDPLALYLASIARLRALPAETLVLPSHGKPFIGLHTRIGQLEDHHAARFADVLEACARAPRPAAELLPVLFKRPLDLHQTTFAMGEAVAHVNALWHARKLERRVDADGIYRYRVPAQAEG